MTRAHRTLDDGLLDRAAALFAQHGYAHTSIKDVADAVGLSKAGLLHHFPSKEALYRAAVDLERVYSGRVYDQVTHLPPGPDRDRRALELLVDIALDRPGLVSLAFRALTAPDEDRPEEERDNEHIFGAFAVDPVTGDPERVIRVVGALSALAVLSLAAARADQKTAWRPHIVSTCRDALGHPNTTEA